MNNQFNDRSYYISIIENISCTILYYLYIYAGILPLCIRMYYIYTNGCTTSIHKRMYYIYTQTDVLHLYKRMYYIYTQTDVLHLYKRMYYIYTQTDVLHLYTYGCTTSIQTDVLHLYKRMYYIYTNGCTTSIHKRMYYIYTHTDVLHLYTYGCTTSIQTDVLHLYKRMYYIYTHGCSTSIKRRSQTRKNFSISGSSISSHCMPACAGLRPQRRVRKLSWSTCVETSPTPVSNHAGCLARLLLLLVLLCKIRPCLFYSSEEKHHSLRGLAGPVSKLWNQTENTTETACNLLYFLHNIT